MLMRIANTSRLALDVQIPSARNAEVALKKGAPIQVGRADVLAEALSVAPSVSDNQMLTLRATVTKGAQALRPAKVLQVRVPFADGGEGWSVPLQSVVRQGDKAYVFVRTGTGFVATPVTVLASAVQSVRVTGGLQAAGSRHRLRDRAEGGMAGQGREQLTC
jgi:hypothetical protein